MFITHSKGHKRTEAGWEYSNTVEEQVDGETRHEARADTGAGRRSRVELLSRQRLVTQ